MTAAREVEAGQLAGLVGTEAGVSDWCEITQALIDRFADVTGDHQYIHVDPERARASPFGTTIAHGFLILSLLPQLAGEARTYTLKGVTTRVNYGFNRIRFTSPVKVGSRIRARFKLTAAAEKQPGQWQLTYDVVVEVEGTSRPALLAEWLGMQFIGGKQQ